jgi:peptidoglycan/LPS O-acetylase OafA/YrhL
MAERAVGSAATTPAPRLHWIDWLRVAAIAGVFVYHSLRPFNAGDWHVKNAETSEAIEAGMIFFWSFGLAVLFLLSGAGARFALRRRTWQAFVRERTLRLLVPFVIAGVLVLSPIQAYIEAVHKGTFDGPFLEGVGRWLAAVVDPAGFTRVSPTFFGLGYHLWFLGFLFAISVLALPLLEVLLSPRGRAVIDALAGLVGRRGSTLLFAVPIGLLMTLGTTLGTEEHDWLEFLWYLGYFVIGFLFVTDERFLPAVRRDGPAALVVAAFCTVLLFFTPVGAALVTAEGEFGPAQLAAGVIFAIEGWASTLVILNIGLRAARLQAAVRPGIGDAVLPVYVVHQPVILAVAFVVVTWPVGIVTKWLVVFGASLAITLTLVELALRIPVTRVLVGARLQPSAPAMPAPEPRHARAG